MPVWRWLPWPGRSMQRSPAPTNTIQIRDGGSARPWPPWPGRAGRRNLVLIGAVISRPEIRAGSALATVPGPGEQQLRIKKRELEGKVASTEPTTGLQNAKCISQKDNCIVHGSVQGPRGLRSVPARPPWPPWPGHGRAGPANITRRVVMRRTKLYKSRTESKDGYA